MKNAIQTGNTVTVPNPYGATVQSGEGLKSGAVFGVSNTTVAPGKDCELDVVGVFELTKDGTAIAARAAVYWDDTARKVTNTATGNTKIGVTLEAAAALATSAVVRLNGTF